MNGKRPVSGNRDLLMNPFYSQSVRRRKRPRRPEGWPPYDPTSNPCVGRGALTPPKPTAKSLSRPIRRGGIHPSRTPSRRHKPLAAARGLAALRPHLPPYPLHKKRTHNRKGRASFVMPAFLWPCQADGLPLSARRQAQSWPPDTPGTSRPAAN